MADHVKQSQAAELSETEGKTLLKLARQTIASKLGKTVSREETSAMEKELKSKIFQMDRGTFVTLTKKGVLRG